VVGFENKILKLENALIFHKISQNLFPAFINARFTKFGEKCLDFEKREQQQKKII